MFFSVYYFLFRQAFRNRLVYSAQFAISLILRCICHTHHTNIWRKSCKKQKSFVKNIQNLKFFYQKKQVIHDFSLKVPANEILSIFGPANSGITTLLRSLNRLYELTAGARVEGKMLLDEKDIHAPDVNVPELRRKVGMVFDLPRCQFSTTLPTDRD